MIGVVFQIACAVVTAYMFGLSAAKPVQSFNDQRRCSAIGLLSLITFGLAIYAAWQVAK